MLHVNLSVDVYVETRLNQRPNNHSMPHNRYGLPTSGNDSEALLQWQFDQHSPPSSIRTFTGSRDCVKTVSAEERGQSFAVCSAANFCHGWARIAEDGPGSHPC